MRCCKGLSPPEDSFKNHWEGSGLHEIVCLFPVDDPWEIEHAAKMSLCTFSISDRTLKLRHIHATSSQVMMFHIWLVTLSYPDIRQYAVKIMLSRDAPSATPWLWMKSIRFPWFFLMLPSWELICLYCLHVDMSATKEVPPKRLPPVTGSNETFFHGLLQNEVHTPFSRFVDSVKICCAVTRQNLPGLDRNVGNMLRNL